MNTEKKAAEAIASFIDSDERFLLLTGTHQQKKHLLVLTAILAGDGGPSTVLFRTNHSTHFDSFLSPILTLHKKPRTGTPIHIAGGYSLYVDTINRQSWSSSPSNIDVAVVYPIDSLTRDKAHDCIEDLLRRQARQIFLVTWTDNQDISWTSIYEPVHVVYDAEEEAPEYHDRMKDVEAKTVITRELTGLPQYAKSTPDEFLVQMHCDGRCGKTRWARLNQPHPGLTALRNARELEYAATCLKCGFEATDNYNSYR